MIAARDLLRPRYSRMDFEQDLDECKLSISKHFVSMVRHLELVDGEDESAAMSTNQYHISTGGNGISKFSYQVLLISTAERLSTHLHTLTDLIKQQQHEQQQHQFEQSSSIPSSTETTTELILQLTSEIIPTMYTLTYLTSLACQDMSPSIGTSIKQDLLCSCMVLVMSFVDCLSLFQLESPITTHTTKSKTSHGHGHDMAERRGSGMLNGLRKAIRVNLNSTHQPHSNTTAAMMEIQSRTLRVPIKVWNKKAGMSVRAFHLFLDRLQKAETVLCMIQSHKPIVHHRGGNRDHVGDGDGRGERVLDLGMDIAQVFGAGRPLVSSSVHQPPHGQRGHRKSFLRDLARRHSFLFGMGGGTHNPDNHSHHQHHQQSGQSEHQEVRRASRKSLGEIVYPQVYHSIDPSPSAPPLPDKISTSWHVSPKPGAAATITATAHRPVSSLTLGDISNKNQEQMPMLHRELAHGLLTRKISLPPPYDQISAQIDFLNAVSRVTGSGIQFGVTPDLGGTVGSGTLTGTSDSGEGTSGTLMGSSSGGGSEEMHSDQNQLVVALKRKEGWARVKVGRKSGRYVKVWLDLCGSRLIAWKSDKNQVKKKKAVVCLDLEECDTVISLHDNDDDDNDDGGGELQLSSGLNVVYIMMFDGGKKEYDEWKRCLMKNQ